MILMNKLNDGTHVVHMTEDEWESLQKRRFKPPSLCELGEFFESAGGLDSDAEAFHLHYQANGWMVGRVKMKDWRSAARKWINRSRNGPHSNSRGAHRNGSIVPSGDLERRLAAPKPPTGQGEIPGMDVGF